MTGSLGTYGKFRGLSNSVGRNRKIRGFGRPFRTPLFTVRCRTGSTGSWLASRFVTMISHASGGGLPVGRIDAGAFAAGEPVASFQAFAVLFCLLP